VAVLSITNTPFIPVSGSYTCKTFSGPHSSISCQGEEEYDMEGVDILVYQVIIIHINLTLAQFQPLRHFLFPTPLDLSKMFLDSFWCFEIIAFNALYD
jgi:hypothetical protein